MKFSYGGVVTAFAYGLLIGFFIGVNMQGSNSQKQERLFEHCLQWKKDFDSCKKEFMPS